MPIIWFYLPHVNHSTIIQTHSYSLLVLIAAYNKTNYVFIYAGVTETISGSANNEGQAREIMSLFKNEFCHHSHNFIEAVEMKRMLTNNSGQNMLV